MYGVCTHAILSIIKCYWKSEGSHLAAAALIAAEDDPMSGPRGIPFDPGKPGGIPLEGGHIEAPRRKPPLGSAGPFPCGEWACIVKE